MSPGESLCLALFSRLAQGCSHKGGNFHSTREDAQGLWGVPTTAAPCEGNAVDLLMGQVSDNLRLLLQSTKWILDMYSTIRNNIIRLHPHPLFTVGKWGKLRRKNLKYWWRQEKESPSITLCVMGYDYIPWITWWHNIKTMPVSCTYYDGSRLLLPSTTAAIYWVNPLGLNFLRKCPCLSTLSEYHLSVLSWGMESQLLITAVGSSCNNNTHPGSYRAIPYGSIVCRFLSGLCLFRNSWPQVRGQGVIP